MLYNDIESYMTNIHKLPECGYAEKWEKVFKSMAVHTRKRLPTELLLLRRPNEEEKIHAYRIANYRAITYGSMNKALDDLYRIVSGVSYTLNVPDNVREYINNTIISQTPGLLQAEIVTARDFIERITLKRDIEDPNGFLVWFPTGAGLTDSSQKVVPQPRLIFSEQFVYSDEFVFIYKEEMVKTEKAKTFYLFTKDDIWKLENEGDEAKPNWVSTQIYIHKIGAFPVIVLGGDMNAEGFYDSFFSPYLAFGDEAIHQFSDWQAIMTTSSFPITEMFGNECSVKRVDKNSTNIPDQEEGFSGGGNGELEIKIMRPDPYGVIPRRIPIPNLNDDTLPVDIPAIRYINPDITIAKYAGESWEKLIDKAEQALNIDMTVGVDQSGVAKQIDKESQYSMISKIGNNFFNNIYEKSVKLIDCYLNGISFEKSGASISKPSTFWIKNESDLAKEIQSLKSNNAPQVFLAEATMDLARKRFAGNPVNERIFKFISLYDPFYTFSVDEKNSMMAGGTLEKDDYIRSLRMFSILQQIVDELTPKVFMEKKLSDIYDIFEEKVSDFLPEDPGVEYDQNGNVINGQVG